MTSRRVAPTPPVSVRGEEAVERVVTTAAESRTDADIDAETVAKEPVTFVTPGATPMTTLPDTVATAIVFEEKVVRLVTSYVVASVRRTTAATLLRW